MTGALAVLAFVFASLVHSGLAAAANEYDSNPAGARRIFLAVLLCVVVAITFGFAAWELRGVEIAWQR